MTEALEDKYIYMCKKYEKLAVDYEALYKLRQIITKIKSNCKYNILSGTS